MYRSVGIGKSLLQKRRVYRRCRDWEIIRINRVGIRKDRIQNTDLVKESGLGNNQNQRYECACGIHRPTEEGRIGSHPTEHRFIQRVGIGKSLLQKRRVYRRCRDWEIPHTEDVGIYPKSRDWERPHTEERVGMRKARIQESGLGNPSYRRGEYIEDVGIGKSLLQKRRVYRRCRDWEIPPTQERSGCRKPTYRIQRKSMYRKPNKGHSQLRKGRTSIPGAYYSVTLATFDRKPLLTTPEASDIIFNVSIGLKATNALNGYVS